MTTYKVTFGSNAWNRSAIVTADTKDEAVTKAVELLAANGEDREWIDAQIEKNKAVKFPNPPYVTVSERK